MEIKVVKEVLAANDTIAAEIRKKLTDNNILALNLISSPGSGKTTLIEKTITRLKGKYNFAVLEGDLATERDAERVARLGVEVVQINTCGGCHLEANQVKDGIKDFNLKLIDILFIENVGNLVCPSSYDLGEDSKVVILSISEGDDKPIKYPYIFRNSEVVVLNKMDLLENSNFSREGFYADLKQVNDQAKVCELSCLTEEGMESWFNWLEGKYRELVKK